MLDRIPTEEDWDNWDDVWTKKKPEKILWDIDMQFAKKNYLGKQREECSVLFQECKGIYGDDYFVMPRKCFQYYIFALAQYLVRIAEGVHRTEDEKIFHSDYEKVSWFLGYIEFRLEHDVGTIAPIFEELWPSIKKILNNKDKFVAEVEKHIYGDFRLSAKEIKTLAQKAKIKI